MKKIILSIAAMCAIFIISATAAPTTKANGATVKNTETYSAPVFNDVTLTVLPDASPGIFPKDMNSSGQAKIESDMTGGIPKLKIANTANYASDDPADVKNMIEQTIPGVTRTNSTGMMKTYFKEDKAMARIKVNTDKTTFTYIAVVIPLKQKS